MEKTEQKVLKFIDGNSLIQKGDKIIVAFSGGPDSVFLLYLLKKYQKRLSVSLSAFHLNHLLRGKDALEDENFCTKFCSFHNIPFYSVRKNVKLFARNKKISVEEAGRIVRYSELDRLLKKSGFNKIATAHHSDDNSETVLLNLIKGTGLKGISGIPFKRGNVIRPILVLTKKEILNYLESKNLKFRTDNSNFEVDQERNFIRNILLPLIRTNLNPSVEKALFNSSQNFKSIYSYLLNSSGSFFNETRLESSVLTIPLKKLSLLNDDLLTFSLKELVERNFLGNLTFKDISSLKTLISQQTGKKINLSSNLIAYKERDKLIISLNNHSEIDKNNYLEISLGEEKFLNNLSVSIKPVDISDVSIGKDKSHEFISADHILNGKFVIRNWQNGDRFIPIGMKGSKKISDYLNELKIESSKKKNQLVLLNGKKIVWVIGHRLDDRFKVSFNTKNVLELCLKKY
jgi:tRNA(Ile)-lysidine synthase